MIDDANIYNAVQWAYCVRIALYAHDDWLSLSFNRISFCYFLSFFVARTLQRKSSFFVLERDLTHTTLWVEWKKRRKRFYSRVGNEGYEKYIIKSGTKFHFICFSRASLATAVARFFICLFVFIAIQSSQSTSSYNITYIEKDEQASKMRGWDRREVMNTIEPENAQTKRWHLIVFHIFREKQRYIIIYAEPRASSKWY